MSLDAPTFIRALRAAANETARLATFLDDLDGWGNGDCDTGANAATTLDAIAATLETAQPSTLSAVLETAVEAGIRRSVGHVGIVITSIINAWAHGLADVNAAGPTPLEIRDMLCATPWETGTTMDFYPAIHSVFDEAIAEIRNLGPTVPRTGELVNIFAAQACYGLVEAVPAGGRTDPGAAVATIIAACLDATVRNDAAMLGDLARMLGDLAARGQEPPPRAPIPEASRAFAVDVLLTGMEEDAEAFRTTLNRLGAHYSGIGVTDVFGIGTWRFHIDTSAPLAARPRCGNVLRFQVVDSRPDELIGEDTLSDGVTHRGIRLLERRPRKRVERATVVSCTRAPGIVEDLARAGAVVFLNVDAQDRDALVDAAAASSTGVAALISCDSATHRLLQAVAADLHERGLTAVMAGTEDELSALVTTRACAPVFVPQPGGRAVANLMESVLSEAVEATRARSRVVAITDGLAENTLPEAVSELLTREPRQMRLLLSAGADEVLAPALRQMLNSVIIDLMVDWKPMPLEVLDGAGPGPSLLQALR